MYLTFFFFFSATLVSLVTVEAQSYGPESIKGIRVVEHIPAGVPPSLPSSQNADQRVAAAAAAVRTATPQRMTPASQAVRRPAAVSTPPVPG